MQTDVIYCDDNLKRFAHRGSFPDESIDLIYLDPPFFSSKKYEVIWGDEGEIRSFEDRWEGGIEVYIAWMKERIVEMCRILKGTGSIYLHCDWHASHYLKAMMDDVFGRGNFRNEIVWHYRTGNIATKNFARRHDVILRYSKGNEWVFNTIEKKQYYTEVYGPGFKPGFKGRKHNKDKNGEYRIIYVDDVWDISAVFTRAKEHLGYPTQKPEALLERIVKASSNKGDVVLDPFCGCGTTLVVAERLGRKWVGIDISPTACSLMKLRLNRAGVKDITIIGLPVTIQDLKALKPFEFQNWVVIEGFNGILSRRKSGDMGIDGYTFLTHEPIQVKQSEKAGRNVVDKFQTAIERKGKKKGCIVAFSFTRGAYEEAARCKREKGLEIELLTIDEMLKKKTQQSN